MTSARLLCCIFPFYRTCNFISPPNFYLALKNQDVILYRTEKGKQTIHIKPHYSMKIQDDMRGPFLISFWGSNYHRKSNCLTYRPYMEMFKFVYDVHVILYIHCILDLKHYKEVILRSKETIKNSFNVF